MKNTVFKKILTIFVLFVVGGGVYMLIELLWRKRTHILMGAAGGVCLNLMYKISKLKHLGFVAKSAVSCVLISAVELIFGVVCNLGLNMNIWDYTKNWGNFCGQICPEYSFYWFLLSLPVTALFGKLNKRTENIKGDRKICEKELTAA